MADYVYRLPAEAPTLPPRALLIGLDWIKYHTPPTAGGLDDQPIQLMRDIRSAVNAYQNIRAWRDAQHLDAGRLQKFYSANGDLVEYMEYIWKLQGIIK